MARGAWGVGGGEVIGPDDGDLSQVAVDVIVVSQ